jgi:hypothetical protein
MRARNIKAGFFENEELAQLPYEARLLFAGLWCYADREGRFEWRPKRIKALLFPYDEIDITCHLMSLHDMTLILQYKYHTNTFGFIPAFKKHQNPHPHEARSTLPDPYHPESMITEQKQCHGMSVKCNADIMIPDTRKPSSSKIFEPESKEMELAVMMRDIINSRSSDGKIIVPEKTNMQTWAKSIDHIHRIDNRSFSEIKRIIEWCQADIFWQNNILSPGKLREKFAQLLLKSNSNNGKSPQLSTYKTLPPDPEYDARHPDLYGESN